ncbi:MAG: hypothetical protein QOG03_1631 [Actinomycetota bacterium]|jgi:RimJ/RimL family protein N-acetyltransferase|nr:hypothetical protein [Actinomycetota bacterium]
MVFSPLATSIDFVLADGTSVHVRPIVPADAPALVAFHRGLSPETIRRRFFSAHPRLSETEAAFFTTVDSIDRNAFVATQAGALVGVARYDRISPTSAEVAFVIDDAHQAHGIASLLLECLAAAAADQGITTLEADTLADNRPMLSVFRHVGSDVTAHWDQGVVHVKFVVDAARQRPMAASAPVAVAV